MPRKPQHPSARYLLAENIRVARAMFGWSQMQLGLECGLDRTFVGALERMTVSAGLDSLDRLAGALGVRVGTLLLEPEEAQPLLYAAYKKQKP